MSCVSYTLAGLAMDCETSKGGIKKVWIATEDPKPTVTDGVIKGFDNTTDWYAYNFKKNTGSMTSTLNVDVANGVNYVSTEATMVFSKMNTIKRLEMQGLAVNDMWVIVLDANGIYWYLGYDEPVNSSAGSGETGTAKTDGNKYSITLLDESETFPYEVDKDSLPFEV